MSTSCSCGTCPSCLQPEACMQSCENGPVQLVNQGSYARVSDWNGNPKNLRNLDNSLLVSSVDGGVKYADGSDINPIILNLLKLIAAEGILVCSTDGKIGYNSPHDAEDYIFGQFNGDLGFKLDTTRPIVFDAAEVQEVSSAGLVGLTCADGNKLTLARFAPGCSGLRYLTINEDNEIVCDTREVDDCPTADEVDDGLMDYILGCKGGKLVIIGPQENKILRYNGGKWSLEEEESEEVWVGGSNVYSRSFAEWNDMNFGEDTVLFGGAVPTNAKWVQIRVSSYCVISNTYGIFRGYVNGTPVIVGRAQGSFQSLDGDIVMYVPYGDGSFTVRGQFTVTGAGSVTGVGLFEAGVLSYR